MRKFLAVTLFLCVALVNAGCEIPDVVVSTIISEGNAVASKVAEALTETAVAGGAVADTPAPGETLPVGGIGRNADRRSRPDPDPNAACPPPRCRTCAWRSSPAAARGWSRLPPRPTRFPPRPASIRSISPTTARWSPTSGTTASTNPAELRVVNYDGSGDRALLTSAQVGALEPLPAGARCSSTSSR